MMLDVARYPHNALLAVIGGAAGVVAIAAILFGYNRSAMIAALLACGAIGAALLAGLW